MVLDLKELFAGGISERAFDYTLDLNGYEEAEGEYPFKEPVRVSGSVISRAGVVTLSVKAESRCFTHCDRCLKELVIPLSVDFRNVLVKSLSGEAADDLIVCEDEKLDLDELVVTNIVLSLPMKHLCREDCKGLCPKCGKNLNEGGCGCVVGNENSLFASLKDMLR